MLAGIVAVATLGFGACGDDDGDDVLHDGVRPFAEVQVDDFEFAADPTTSNRGIFRVTTTEPMICAIVWGETEAFGNFNNSLAMSGTGIIDHDVFLPGAEAGRTYYFQVQGSTADGTLYRSEVGTFEIAVPTRSAAASTASAVSGADGVNLALDASIVEVSSEFSDAFAAANAIDDSGTTEWSSAGDGDDAFITIDLGTDADIGSVEFITRSMADGTAITETFSVTVDGDEVFGPFPAGTPIAPAPAVLDTTGQLLRFDVETSSGGNVGAVEIRVLEAD